MVSIVKMIDDDIILEENLRKKISLHLFIIRVQLEFKLSHAIFKKKTSDILILVCKMQHYVVSRLTFFSRI